MEFSDPGKKAEHRADDLLDRDPLRNLQHVMILFRGQMERMGTRP